MKLRSDQGLKLLGNPVGTSEYRRDNISSLVTSMSLPLPALSQVSPSSAYAMLHLCYNSRPSFLARVSDPSLSAVALASFDDSIDLALSRIIGCPPSPTLRSIRSLPQSMGGGGIFRHAGPHSARGVSSVRTRFTAYLDEYCDILRSGVRFWSPPPEDWAAHSPFPAPDVGSIVTPLPESLQTDAREFAPTMLGLYNNLLIENRKHAAAIFLSNCYKGSGACLAWKVPVDPRFRLNEQEFLETIRLRSD